MKTRHAIRVAAATAAMSLLGLASAARASVLASDNFSGDTPGTSLSATSASEGTGWSGAWSNYQTASTGSDPGGSVVAANLSYNGNTYSNAAQLAQTGGVNAYAFRPMSSLASTTGGTSLYASFLLNGVGTTGNNVDIMSLYAGSTVPTYNSTGGLNAGATVHFGSVNNAGDIGFQYTSSNGTNTTYDTTTNNGNYVPASTSAVTLLVLELDYGGSGNDTIKLYVNPTSTNPASAAAEFMLSTTIYSYNGSSGTADQQIGMVRLGTNSTTGPDMTELEVGTSFADVVPELVPEPATIALIAAAPLLLLRRQSKR